MEYKTEQYFLGEATAEGFRTDFLRQIRQEGYFTYILKGGPGTGKSSLMKRIAREFAPVDDVELYACSSDPDSLDAVLLKNAKVIVMDGTAPHTFDPEYPGIGQCIVNLGDFWNEDLLAEKASEIKNFTEENAAWHQRARRYLTALSSLNSDIADIGEKALLSPKLESFLQRYAKRILPKKASGTGSVILKQISAITQEGYITKLPKELALTVMIDDPFFAAGDSFLKALSKVAVQKGLTVIVSPGRLFGRETYEHLVIPELKIGFFTRSFLGDTPIPDREKINMERFYDKAILSSKRQRLSFDRKAAGEMKSEVMYSIQRAKEVHDRLEECYIRAMDFDKINSAGEKILRQIEKKYQK